MAMTNATFIGRLGALAVALGIGLAVASPPGVAMADADNDADSTILMMCGATCPQWDAPNMEIIMNQFVTPTHPEKIFRAPVAVRAPGEAWPLTGVLRLLEFAAADPRLGTLGGPAWPDEPLWKLSGLFDLTGDQSVEAGAAALEAAIDTALAAHPDDHLVVYAYSQGATAANVVKDRLAAKYPEGTTAPDIAFVLGGDVRTPNGGLYTRFPGLYLPILDWTFTGPEATDTQFDTVVINRQYDGFADFPLYPLNVVADVNALLGAMYVHGWPFDANLTPGPSTDAAYQGTSGNTSYYSFKTENLPLFGPLRTLGVPEALIDVVEPVFRVIVELGYDRTITPLEPTPARLLPKTFDPAKVLTDLAKAVGEGFNNALALFGAPSSARVAAPKAVNADVTEGEPVKAGAAQPNPSVTLENSAASPTGVQPQSTPEKITKPRAKWNPTRLVRRLTEQKPAAAPSVTDNASAPDVEPTPAHTAPKLKAQTPDDPSAVRKPIGLLKHDLSAAHNERSAKPASPTSPAGSPSKNGAAGDSSPGGADS
jgi:hypothetical protein